MPTYRTKPKVSAASACNRLTGVLRLSIASCLAIAAVAIPAHTYAQTAATGVISGRVANSATGAYLENAQVRIVGTDRILITQPGGYYSFTGVPVGAVTVSASYTGLDNLEQKATATAGATTTLDFNLTTAEYGEVMQLGEFVVSSAREGNAKAIVEQREAANIKTVIASDAFGSVSEDNIGEFLKYMSGLTIDYVENDARTVRVRGLSSKYASVTIDGNPVASADNAIGTGRDFQFEQVSLSTIDTIELNKTPLADQAANSLAGTINVKSKSALNQKGRRINYSLNLTGNEYAMELDKTIGWDNQEHYKVLPGASLEFSDTLLSGRLGVVVGINHTATYVEQKLIAGLGRTFDSNPDNNESEIPRITSVNWQDGPKPTTRDSVLVNLDFKATSDLTLSLRTMYNMYDAPFHNRNWTFAGTTTANDMASLSASSAKITASGATNVTTGALTDTANAVTTAGTNFRKYGATFSINPAVNWKITPNITFDGSLSYSRSYQWYDSGTEGFFNVVSARMNGVSWGFTSTPGEPNLQMQQYAARSAGAADTRSYLDLANYTEGATATLATRDVKDQIWTGRGDITVKLPQFRMPTILKFGGDNRLLVKDIQNWTNVWTMDTTSANSTRINLANYADPYTPSFHKDETITDLNGRRGSAPATDKWRLYDLFLKYNTDPLTITSAAQQPFFLTEGQVATNLRNKIQNQWDFKETIQSAYILANVKPLNKLQVVGGLRFESTEAQGVSFDDIGHRSTLRAMGLATTIATNSTTTNRFDYIQTRFGGRKAKEQSYDDLFPSAQARYALLENLNLRAAYYRSILRPDPANLARGITISDDELSFSTANPDLKPEYANNYEVRAEYYFEPVGVISAGVFYKDLTDAQISVNTQVDAGDLPQEILDLYPNLVPTSYSFTRVTNAAEAKVKGFELDYSQALSFLPGAFSGLSVFANYTYTTTDNPGLFVGGSGVPKKSANTGINYRLKDFTSGIKFNWVGERILAARGTNGIGNYEKDRLQIDINLSYKISRRATIFFNGANIFDAPSYRYNEREELINRHGSFGAKFTLGVKGSF